MARLVNMGKYPIRFLLLCIFEERRGVGSETMEHIRTKEMCVNVVSSVFIRFLDKNTGLF